MFETPNAFKHQIDPETSVPYKKVYDARNVLREGEKGIDTRFTEDFGDLRSIGKSLAQ